MNQDLRNLSETQLLQIVLDIVSKRETTGIDLQELEEVNCELARRDAFKLAMQYHPSLEEE